MASDIAQLWNQAEEGQHGERHAGKVVRNQKMGRGEWRVDEF